MTDTGYKVADAALKETKALPNGAGTANCTAFDLGQVSYLGARLAPMEGRVSAPALTTTELPDGKTVNYTVQQSADGVSWSTLAGSLITQTGAGGAGAAAAVANYAIPSNCLRYLRVQAVAGAGAGDCSGKSVTHQLVF